MVGSMWQLYCTTVFLLFSPVVLETITAHTDDFPCILEDEAKVQVVCYNLDSLDRLQNITQKVQQLTVTDSTFKRNDSFTLPPFPELEHVIFKRSFVNFISKPWPANLPKLSSLTFEACWSPKEYRVRNLSELVFESENFQLLPALKTLTFKNNSLSNIQSIHLLKTVERKNIEGGGVFCNCTYYWYENWSRINAHFSKETLCYVTSSFIRDTCLTAHQLPTRELMEHLTVTYELCPPKCNCSLSGFQAEERDPFVNVKCENAGLKEMPESIPPTTTSIEYANNELQSIDAWFQNPNYKNVHSAFFTNNKIEEINEELFLNFSLRKKVLVLFLENNLLRKLPIKVLEDMMKWNSAKDFWMLTLGGNPWDCEDCTFIRVLQKFLNQPQKYQKEFHTIRCAGNNQRAILFDVDERCPVRKPLDTIDYLNIAVALLFLIVLANFLHNFYNYRRYNRLPWIMICRLRQDQ